jgi:hypothetical protein
MMIGLAFGYPSEFEQQLGVRDEPQFAYMVIKRTVSTLQGRELGPLLWRKWELPLETREIMAKEIENIVGVRSRQITGFTLFWNGSHIDGQGNKIEPGYQMSIRRADDKGAWSIRRIEDAEARVILDRLKNIGHPDGPWELTDERRADLRDNYIVPQSAAEGWPKKELPKETEYFDDDSGLERTNEWPYARKRRPDDLLSILEAAEVARRAGTEALATLVAGEP